jgi:hypothetical protein
MLPPALLWVDPGGMTGLARLRTAPAFETTRVMPVFFEADEFAFTAACLRIENMCEDYRGRLWLGWERFDITSNTHKLTRQSDALHVIGVCRFLAQKYGVRVLEPAQQMTPTKAEQEKLKALGWWVPGKDDAQSASAHLLRYLVRERELPPRETEILRAL